MAVITRRNAGLCFGMVLALACAPVNDEASGLAELEQAIEAFYASIESGDNDSRAEMFTDGAMMMPNKKDCIRSAHLM